MQHPDEGIIHAWLDGELGDDEIATLEAHVAECPDCAARVAEARGLVAASSRIVSALDSVPAGVIPAANRPTINSSWYSTPQFRAVAAVAVVAVGLIVILNNRGQREMARAVVAVADTPRVAATAAAAPLSPAAEPLQQSPVKESLSRRTAKAPPSVHLSAKDSAPGAFNKLEPQSIAQAVAAGAPAPVAPREMAADAISGALKLVSSDTLQNSVRNVYEVTPGVQIALTESPVELRGFVTGTVQSTAGVLTAPRMRQPPPAAAKSIRDNAVSNSIKWVKGSQVFTLSGPMTVEQLQALRERLPPDKR